MKRPLHILSLVFFTSLVFTGSLYAANKTFTGPGNFSDNTKWNGNTLPVAGDNLRINGTCTFDNAAANLAYGTLNVGFGVAGTLNWPAGGTNTFNVTNVSSSTAGSAIDMTNGGTLQIRGTWTTTNQTFTPGTGTVIFASTANRTMPAAITTYNHLTINPSADIIVSLGVGTTVNGNVVISTGTLDVTTSNFALNVKGNFTNNATFNARAGTVTFNGTSSQAMGGSSTTSFGSLTISNASVAVTASTNLNVSSTMTVNANARLTPAAAVVINNGGATGTITGSGTVDVTRTAATADYSSQYKFTTNTLTNLTVDYTAAGQVLSNLTYGNLRVSGSITGAGNSATVGGTFTATGTFTPTSGTITMNNGSSIVNSGTLTFSALTIASGATVSTSSSFSISGALTLGSSASNFSPSSGTITMNNGASIVNTVGGTLAFNNLTIANSATVTTSSSFSINGALSVGTSANFSPSGGTITMNNGSSITNSATLAFSSLTIPSSATVTVNSNFSVDGTLTLNNDLAVGSNTLTMGSAATTAGSFEVTGSVKRTSFVTGTTYTFGHQNTSITFASGTFSSPSITVTLTKGSTPAGKADAITRYFDIPSSGVSAFSATLRLHYLDSELNSNTEADLVLWKDAGIWSEQGRTGSVDATNNFAELSDVASFSTWTLANNTLDHFDVSLTSPQTSRTAFTGTNTITAKDPSDFSNGVANVTGALKFSGNPGNHTFTATSANGKTGTSGTVVINRATTNWTGSVDSDWNNSANWSNGVPDSTTNIVVSTNSPAPRVPTTNARVFNLTVNNGGTVLWANCGGALYVHGAMTLTNGGVVDLGTCTPANQLVFLNNLGINNGGTFSGGNGAIDLKGSSWSNNPGSSFNAGTSTVTVDGTGDQTISGDITFYNLVVDNPNGTVTFADDVVVENDMTISSGSTVDVQASGSLTVVGDFTNDGSAPSVKPYMISAVAISLTQVDVTFSEDVDQATAETASNYSIRTQSGGTISISSATRDASNLAVVHLTPSSSLTAGNVDTLVVSNVKDLTGGDAIQPNSRKKITSAAFQLFHSRATGNWNDATSWSFTSHTGAAASRAPGSSASDSVIVGNSNTITLDVNVSNMNLVRINSTGTLNTGAFTISGSGNFELNSGGSLGIGSANGITSSGSSGSIQTSTRTFSTGANYTYNGTSAQVTGNGLPSTVNNLTINNSAGVTLTASTSPTGDLTISAGTFDLGSNTVDRASAGGTLTLSSGATLKIGGTGTLPADYSTHTIGATSTVEYAGTNQTVATLNSSQNYGNLTISGSGTKTLAGNIGVAAELTISAGTFDLGTNTANRTASGGTLSLASAATLKVGGSSGGVTGSNFPKDFTTSTLSGTVEFNGTGSQTIPVFSYTHLTFTNGGTKSITSSITATGNVTINSGAPVSVSDGVTLQVNGNMTNSGSLTNNGTITVGQ